MEFLLNEIITKTKETSFQANDKSDIEKKIYKKIGLDLDKKPIKFHFDIKTISEDSLHELATLLRRVKCAQKLLEPISNPENRLDIKNIVFNGRVLDVLESQEDFRILIGYLESMRTDEIDYATAKVEYILDCIDQISSLKGQWQKVAVRELNNLVKDCLAEPIGFFHVEVSKDTAKEVKLLNLIKDLSKKYENNYLKALLSELQRKEEETLDKRWPLTKVIHDAYPLKGASVNFLLAGIGISVIGLSVLDPTFPAKCDCSFSASLVNTSTFQEEFNDSSNSYSALGRIVTGVGLVAFPLINKICNMYCYEKRS